MLFAYFGPDTLLPMTSLFAAVVGVFLMFGRALWQSGLFLLQKASGKTRQKAVRPSASTLRPDFGHAESSGMHTRHAGISGADLTKSIQSANEE